MLKKLPLLGLLAFFCLFTTSCEYEPLQGQFIDYSPADPENPDDPNNPDPSGGTGEYWPLAEGNNWVFSNSQSSNFQMALDDSPINITGTTTINGHTYFQMPSFISIDAGNTDMPPGSSASVVDNGGVRYANGDYTQVVDMNIEMEMGGFTTTTHNQSNPLIFFKENATAGTSWTVPMELTMTIELMGQTQTETQSMDYYFTVVEKDVTATVNGQTFENVVKVKVEMQTGDAITHFWLAKDVGPIFIEYIELTNNNEWARREISSYSLN